MNIDGPDLEDRYRRVLRLLPGYYRAAWEDDMVAAYLDSRMTGDEDEDEYIFEFGRPAWPEAASVAGLAARLYLGGAGTPRRYFAWGQAVRRAVLAVALVHAVQGLTDLTLLAWRRHQAGWAPALPASLTAPVPGGMFSSFSAHSPRLADSDGRHDGLSRWPEWPAQTQGAGAHEQDSTQPSRLHLTHRICGETPGHSRWLTAATGGRALTGNGRQRPKSVGRSF